MIHKLLDSQFFLRSTLLSTPHSRLVAGMTLSPLDFVALDFRKNLEECLQARAREQIKCLELLDMKGARCIIPRQTHSTDIHYVNYASIDANAYFYGDGLYCFEDNILLGVTVADCAGILLYDTSTNFFAALHSGWRGTVGSMGHNTQKSISQRCIEIYYDVSKNNINNLHVWISPCAKSCCYQIGQELVPLFNSYPQCIHTVHTDTTIQYFLDISTYIYLQMVSLGIPSKNIEISPFCTICNEQFHSHRRVQAQNALKTPNKERRSMVFIGRN